MDIVTLGGLGTQGHTSIEETFLVWVFIVAITTTTITMMTNALNLDLKNRVVHSLKIFLLPVTIHQAHQQALNVFPKISPAAQADRLVAPAPADHPVAPVHRKTFQGEYQVAQADRLVAPVHRKTFQGEYQVAQVVRLEAREVVKASQKASQAKTQINTEDYFSIIC